VILLDDVKERAVHVRLIQATLIAGNRVRDRELPPTPDEAIKEFDRKLTEPLRLQAQKVRALQLVRSI